MGLSSRIVPTVITLTGIEPVFVTKPLTPELPDSSSLTSKGVLRLERSTETALASEARAKMVKDFIL